MFAINCIFLFFYGGPDQLIPLASFLGAIIGFLLIFWQRFVAMMRRGFKFIGQKIGLSKDR